MPVVTGRFVSHQRTARGADEGQHFPRRMLENAELSWADAPPDGRQGDAGQVVDRREAQRRSPWARAWPSGCIWAWARQVELETGGAVRHAEGGGDLSRRRAAPGRARCSSCCLQGRSKDEPSTWYGGAHIDPKQVAAMERALFRAYPTVTVINMADVLDAH